MRWVLFLLLSLPLFSAELHDAVRKLNQSEVIRLLEHGADINALNEKGETAMHMAARIGRFSMVQTLLKYEPDLAIENRQGYTPLAIAIHYNYIKTIQALVKAQKKRALTEKLPPLHQAAQSGDIKALQELLVSHAIEELDAKGRTALQIAAREGELETVKFLIVKGADPKHVDQEGRDVVYFARFGGNKDIIKYIEQEIEKRGSE